MIARYDTKCEACGCVIPAGSETGAAAKFHRWAFLCKACAAKAAGNFKKPRQILEAVMIYNLSDDADNDLDHHDWDVLVDLGLHAWPA